MSASAPAKKIPDMFLRALKRKAEPVVTSDVGSDGNLEKRTKLEEQVQKPRKENIVPGNNFTLFDLLTEKAWRSILRDEFTMKYMVDIETFLRAQYAKKVPVFPPRDEIFSAFNLTPLNKIRVVIIGQDPYHGVGQAHGLSFSVKKGVPPPPSLKNIYKELCNDIPGFVTPDHGFLEKWALQGVFMLNATLTVESGKANSHEKIGWQKFTDKVISLISLNTTGVVFLLWGGFARKKESLVDLKKHAVIKTAHPSPLSASKWFGCKCFSKTNAELSRMGRPPIDWKSL
ncbi:uracil-DNA glycosylase [Teladorsagia circumcincta]|uniref:Uracil-DNA glycosylase n=2 Tax=Teladorsagia circumcincta TaxID=45464 RepID=A0A2G9UEG6_TELCI|nr:uracil-DNA glycosylase [Teladorsagia circumcincta]